MAMDHRPGTIPPQRIPHPRRPPAHRSVCLRHSPLASGRPPKAPTFSQPQFTSLSSPNPPASDKANPPSTTSPKVRSNQHSSGESSDAGNWFESSNNNALQRNNSFADNDPPFFLHNSSSSEDPPDGHGLHDKSGQQTSVPYRSGPTLLRTDGSSTEDFRSVIDDLTVANKKLRQKLKKYERLYDQHLQDEKLFEVRFHGLSGHKKKELEATLQKFAAELGDSLNGETLAVSHPPPLFGTQKTVSSQTSRLAESGYASMSASGQHSMKAPSNQASNQASVNNGDRRRMTKSQYNRQQQSIQSFLHDIPAGLLPTNQATMSERSRKKLIVRRLEQVFVGKRSTPGNRPQPLQQEEVAQSAAMADRQAKEATGQQHSSEGHREARIMAAQADEEDRHEQGTAESLQRPRPYSNTKEQDFAGIASPDQRPTRPLDLDPYRAQASAENMDYFRHLGFTPPNMVTGEAPQLGHGWLYLNLVINMAQLHTLNVTPEHVKDAVTDFSSMLELSHDGRKLRWKGGQEESRMASGSSSEHLSLTSPNEYAGGPPIKRRKTGHSGSGESTAHPEQRGIAGAHTAHNKLTYTPIFIHKESSESDDDYYGYKLGSCSDAPNHIEQPGGLFSISNSALRSSSPKRKRDYGPMIFYNKAKFCTDLSGDHRGRSSLDPNAYRSITKQPLGVTSTLYTTTQGKTSSIGETRHTFDASTIDIDTADDTETSPSGEELDFFPEALRHETGSESPNPIVFEASGLGGVQPDDNLAIRVHRSQTRTTAPWSSFMHRKWHLYPKRIVEALDEHKTNELEGPSTRQLQPMIKEELLSASSKLLPSSTLPPASFLPIDSASSGDVDSDLGSDISSGPSTTSSSSQNGPATARQILDATPTYHANRENESEEDSDEDDESDDGSIDLLATARQMDPNTIRACEREYEAALADRIAEIIPAGSSAATGGVGSGCNSPEEKLGAVVEAAGVETRQTRVAGQRDSTAFGGIVLPHPESLKRTRNYESDTTPGPHSQRSRKYGE